MSYLTTPQETLEAELIAALEGEGFSYNPLRTSWTQYLSTALGQPNAYLFKSEGQLLTELDAQYGGSLSHLRASIAQLLDDVAANIGAGGGGGGEDAGAVFWDGTSKLHNDALACGAHSKVSTVICYRQPVGPANTAVLSGFEVTDPTGVYAGYSEVDQINGSSYGGIQFSVGDSDGNYIAASNSAAHVDSTPDVWHVYMYSVDATSGGVSNIVSTYLDDVTLDAYNDPGSNPSTVIAGDGVPLWVGSVNETQLPYDMARYFKWYGIQIDWSDAANRRKFFTADGKLEDPSVAVAQFGEPIAKFYGNAASWLALATSQGFDIDGSLTNATGSPPVA